MSEADLVDRVRELVAELESLKSWVDTIGACAARADKTRELINDLRRDGCQIGFVENDHGDADV